MENKRKTELVRAAGNVIQNRISQLNAFEKEIREYDDGIAGNAGYGFFLAICLAIGAVFLAIVCPQLSNMLLQNTEYYEVSKMLFYIGMYALATYLMIDAIRMYVTAGQTGKMQEILRQIHDLKTRMERDLRDLNRQIEELSQKTERRNIHFTKKSAGCSSMTEFREQIDQYKGIDNHAIGMSLSIAYWVASSTLTVVFLLLTSNFMGETIASMFDADSSREVIEFLMVAYIVLGTVLYILLNLWVNAHMKKSSMSSLMISLCSGPAAIPAGLLISLIVMAILFVLSVIAAILILVLVMAFIFGFLSSS